MNRQKWFVRKRLLNVCQALSRAKCMKSILKHSKFEDIGREWLASLAKRRYWLCGWQWVGPKFCRNSAGRSTGISPASCMASRTTSRCQKSFASKASAPQLRTNASPFILFTSEPIPTASDVSESKFRHSPGVCWSFKFDSWLIGWASSKISKLHHSVLHQV